MKRIKLTHGSARVGDNCSDKTIKALDKLSKLAYEFPFCECETPKKSTADNSICIKCKGKLN